MGVSELYDGSLVSVWHSPMRRHAEEAFEYIKILNEVDRRCLEEQKYPQLSRAPVVHPKVLRPLCFPWDRL